jgi:hypothetical protein
MLLLGLRVATRRVEKAESYVCSQHPSDCAIQGGLLQEAHVHGARVRSVRSITVPIHSSLHCSSSGSLGRIVEMLCAVNLVHRTAVTNNEILILCKVPCSQ